MTATSWFWQQRQKQLREQTQDTLEAMLKQSRKQMNQRLNPPIEKHATETFKTNDS